MFSDLQKHSVAISQEGSSSLQPIARSFRVELEISDTQDQLELVSLTLTGKVENVHVYPIARPQRWPSKLVFGTKKVMKIASTKGVVHVGT